jgi:magnesium-transporting ATPase (P-type)
MKKKKTGKYLFNKKELWDFVWRFTLSIIVVIFFIRIFIYPERAMIKEYRKKLTNSHCVTKAFINATKSSSTCFLLIYYIKINIRNKQ